MRRILRTLIAISGSMLFSLAAAADPTTHSKPPTGDALIGAWRLVEIRYQVNGKAEPDPFYGSDSQGQLLYSANHSMSVHIMGTERPALPAAADRSSRTHPASEQALAAAAYDSYYAYFGTWEYDADHAIVTHHVQGALIPAETGLSYSQVIALDGDQLIFINRSQDGPNVIERQKRWRRIR